MAHVLSVNHPHATTITFINMYKAIKQVSIHIYDYIWRTYPFDGFFNYDWRIFSKISLALAVLARGSCFNASATFAISSPSAPTTMAKDLYCRLICPC